AHNFSALKVVKSAVDYTESALDEIRMLKSIYRHRDLDTNRTKIIQLFDDFRIDGLRGMHVVMVFEALGPNLLKLIKRTNYQGIPLYLVKHIIRQVLQGLKYLHETCHIIHTDIKPENILICAQHQYIKLTAENSCKQMSILNFRNLKHISNLKPWYLYDVLTEKYEWNTKEAKAFSSFLTPMLDLDQDNRASATQCLLNPWMLA
ncbi:PREDICTED: SRSF protein kinase 1-like, partial [Diuraphis noxia]|uniref:SRSF protein kinase 1-like n=1 Tax=Diuraphis noxia TaxID=143948 RepID=UPI0007639DB7